jgi:hypothetical protein
MCRKAVIYLIILTILCFLFQISPAQQSIRMTDEQWIQLALDMIRKGIQQEDTAKVFKAFAPEIRVGVKNAETKKTLGDKLQAVFNDSTERLMFLEKPPLSGKDSPLRLSDFWDFDILNPRITIAGDTAIVDCELILWGAPPESGSGRAGRRIKERFVFATPVRVEKDPPWCEYYKWPTPPSGKSRAGSMRAWQLTGFENLLNFLASHGKTNDSPQEKTRAGGK